MVDILPPRSSFADYQRDAGNWITLATGEYYPDVLKDAVLLYTPVIQWFGRLLRTSETSERLWLSINEITQTWMRIQLCRVFKRYVSPATPVEMLKRKKRAMEMNERFGRQYRPIHEVQAAFDSRSADDEALCALLWEYKGRGKKGCDLTERFFELFLSRFPGYSVLGPKRAGKDILLSNVLPDYPNQRRPVDFIIRQPVTDAVLIVGLARYDGDRGGSQEDDRTGQYLGCAREVPSYADKGGHPIKVLFINDGPGLLLGSMWRDYAAIEGLDPNRVMIATLRMVPERLTRQWFDPEAEQGNGDRRLPNPVG